MVFPTRCAIFLVRAAPRKENLERVVRLRGRCPLCRQGKKPETGYRELCLEIPKPARRPSPPTPANRKQVGQLNRCRLVTGTTSLTSSDRCHCISMPQVGQVGASRSSSECWSVCPSQPPQGPNDESPQAQQQSLFVAGLTSSATLFTTFLRRLLGITRTDLRMFRGRRTHGLCSERCK